MDVNIQGGRKYNAFVCKQSAVYFVQNLYEIEIIEPALWNTLNLFLVHQRFLFQSGDNAAALTVAEQYVQAFGNLAKTSNTVILPANTGDAASMVAQVCELLS